MLFLEIDGLAEPILRRAIDQGDMPTLQRWLTTGTHRLLGWEPDLSSDLGQPGRYPPWRQHEHSCLPLVRQTGGQADGHEQAGDY